MRSIPGDRFRASRNAGRFLHYWLPVIAWMALIFIVSDQPQLPRYPTGMIDLLLKKLGHLTEYAVLAVLVQRALVQGGACSTVPVLPCLLSIVYALSDEYHQLFVPGRNGNLWDVGVDTLGAVIGLALYARCRLWRPGRNQDLPEKLVLNHVNLTALDELEDSQE